MKKTGGLHAAAAVIFLALAAWTLAYFLARSAAPRTLRAEYCELESVVEAEGMIVRSETVLVCSDPDALLTHRTGERIQGGSVAAVRSEWADEYLSRLDENASTDGLRGLIRAPCGGYFSSFTDGLESAGVDEILDARPSLPAGAVGKIVSGGWYFVSDTAEAERFDAGQTVTLTLAGEYEATVVSADDGRLVLRCREGLDSVLDLRGVRLSIELPQARGIKVPDSALHRGEDGFFVYVLRARLTERAEVEPCFDGDGFVLVREGALRRGMSIITGQVPE